MAPVVCQSPPVPNAEGVALWPWLAVVKVKGNTLWAQCGGFRAEVRRSKDSQPRAVHLAYTLGMARDDELAAAGGEALGLAMRRRGLTAPQLAQKSRGEVSSSSVRAWAEGQTLPTPRKALAVAQALGDPEAGAEVLRAWGMLDAAEGLQAAPVEPPAQYRVEADGIGFRRVAIGHTFTATITSILETSLGEEWTAETDSGSIIRIIPIYAVTVDPRRAAVYAEPPPEVAAE